METADGRRGLGGCDGKIKNHIDIIVGYGIQEYYNDTIEKRRNFKKIGLYVYNNKKSEVVRLPCENSIAYFLYDFPFFYYEEYLKLYFVDTMINDLKANKINNYNALLNYIRRPIL